MFEKFIKTITNVTNLDDTEISYLRKHAKVKEYKKGESIISDGKIVRNIYFVLTGCVRLYYNVNGKDKTAFFYTDGNFIWANKSLKDEIPTQKNFEVVEDSTIIKIDKNVFYHLVETSPNFETIIKYGKEKELIAYQQQIVYFITLTPEERFIRLLETNGVLFQRVSQQYIASYLGISAETLSRIKRRVFEKYKEELYA